MFKFFLPFTLCLLLAFPVHSSAMDVLKSFIPASNKDPRSNFDVELYSAVMDATKHDYGPFEIILIKRDASQDRDLAEVTSGEIVNVDIVAARPEWEEATIPIRIPLLKGMLGIRLFLIRNDKAHLFENIQSVDELKTLKMGMGRTWTITKAFEAEKFSIVKGTAYEGLFGMLNSERFDCFPRGLNEIYYELEKWQGTFPEFVVESRLALQIPLPSFFFVSPQHPLLAERIKAGLQRIMKDGSYDALFDKYYGTLYKKAQISKRRIFKIPNPVLTDETLKAIQ